MDSSSVLSFLYARAAKKVNWDIPLQSYLTSTNPPPPYPIVFTVEKAAAPRAPKAPPVAKVAPNPAAPKAPAPTAGAAPKTSAPPAGTAPKAPASPAPTSGLGAQRHIWHTVTPSRVDSGVSMHPFHVATAVGGSAHNHIIAGPKELHGATLGGLIEHAPSTHALTLQNHNEGRTPAGATGHPNYGEVADPTKMPKLSAKAHREGLLTAAASATPSTPKPTSSFKPLPSTDTGTPLNQLTRAERMPNRVPPTEPSFTVDPHAGTLLPGTEQPNIPRTKREQMWREADFNALKPESQDILSHYIDRDNSIQRGAGYADRSHIRNFLDAMPTLVGKQQDPKRFHEELGAIKKYIQSAATKGQVPIRIDTGKGRESMSPMSLAHAHQILEHYEEHGTLPHWWHRYATPLNVSGTVPLEPKPSDEGHFFNAPSTPGMREQAKKRGGKLPEGEKPQTLPAAPEEAPEESPAAPAAATPTMAGSHRAVATTPPTPTATPAPASGSAGYRTTGSGPLTPPAGSPTPIPAPGPAAVTPPPPAHNFMATAGATPEELQAHQAMLHPEITQINAELKALPGDHPLIPEKQERMRALIKGYNDAATRLRTAPATPTVAPAPVTPAAPVPTAPAAPAPAAPAPVTPAAPATPVTPPATPMASPAPVTPPPAPVTPPATPTAAPAPVTPATPTPPTGMRGGLEMGAPAPQGPIAPAPSAGTVQGTQAGAPSVTPPSAVPPAPVPQTSVPPAPTTPDAAAPLAQAPAPPVTPVTPPATPTAAPVSPTPAPQPSATVPPPPAAAPQPQTPATPAAAPQQPVTVPLPQTPAPQQPAAAPQPSTPAQQPATPEPQPQAPAPQAPAAGPTTLGKEHQRLTALARQAAVENPGSPTEHHQTLSKFRQETGYRPDEDMAAGRIPPPRENEPYTPPAPQPAAASEAKGYTPEQTAPKPAATRTRAVKGSPSANAEEVQQQAASASAPAAEPAPASTTPRTQAVQGSPAANVAEAQQAAPEPVKQEPAPEPVKQEPAPTTEPAPAESTPQEPAAPAAGKEPRTRKPRTKKDEPQTAAPAGEPQVPAEAETPEHATWRTEHERLAALPDIGKGDEAPHDRPVWASAPEGASKEDLQLHMRAHHRAAARIQQYIDHGHGPLVDKNYPAIEAALHRHQALRDESQGRLKLPVRHVRADGPFTGEEKNRIRALLSPEERTVKATPERHAEAMDEQERQATKIRAGEDARKRTRFQTERLPQADYPKPEPTEVTDPKAHYDTLDPELVHHYTHAWMSDLARRHMHEAEFHEGHNRGDIFPEIPSEHALKERPHSEAANALLNKYLESQEAEGRIHGAPMQRWQPITTGGDQEAKAKSRAEGAKALFGRGGSLDNLQLAREVRAISSKAGPFDQHRAPMLPSPLSPQHGISAGLNNEQMLWHLNRLRKNPKLSDMIMSPLGESYVRHLNAKAGRPDFTPYWGTEEQESHASVAAARQQMEDNIRDLKVGKAPRKGRQPRTLTPAQAALEGGPKPESVTYPATESLHEARKKLGQLKTTLGQLGGHDRQQRQALESEITHYEAEQARHLADNTAAKPLADVVPDAQEAPKAPAETKAEPAPEASPEAKAEPERFVVGKRRMTSNKHKNATYRKHEVDVRDRQSGNTFVVRASSNHPHDQNVPNPKAKDPVWSVENPYGAKTSHARGLTLPEAIAKAKDLHTNGVAPESSITYMHGKPPPTPEPPTPKAAPPAPEPPKAEPPKAEPPKAEPPKADYQDERLALWAHGKNPTSPEIEKHLADYAKTKIPGYRDHIDSIRKRLVSGELTPDQVPEAVAAAKTAGVVGADKFKVDEATPIQLEAHRIGNLGRITHLSRELASLRGSPPNTDNLDSTQALQAKKDHRNRVTRIKQMLAKATMTDDAITLKQHPKEAPAQEAPAKDEQELIERSAAAYKNNRQKLVQDLIALRKKEKKAPGTHARMIDLLEKVNNHIASTNPQPSTPVDSESGTVPAAAFNPQIDPAMIQKIVEDVLAKNKGKT